MNSEFVQNLEADAEAVIQPLENLAKGEAQDVIDLFYTAMKQLPQIALDELQAAIPAVFAAAVPGATAASVGAAVAAAAIETLKTQGTPILDQDLAAFQGAALATAVSAVHSAAALPATATTTDAAPEVSPVAATEVQTP